MINTPIQLGRKSTAASTAFCSAAIEHNGRTLYVAAWGTQSFFRLTRGSNPPRRDDVPLGFRVDNIHWARDGSLLAAGQAQGGWKAVKIDPATLAVRDVLEQAEPGLAVDGRLNHRADRRAF